MGARTFSATNEHQNRRNGDAVEGTKNTTYATWLATRKIAMRWPGCYSYDRSREVQRILAAYAHALKLADGLVARAYRNALIDAMAEYSDDYGSGPSWTALAKATQGQARSPMRELACFFFALSHKPMFFNISGPMGEGGVLVPKQARGRLERCWRRHLETIDKDGRASTRLATDAGFTNMVEKSVATR